MKIYKLTIKVSEYNYLHFTVNGYSNNDKRIRFIDQKTGETKNFPEEWVAIETQEVREWLKIIDLTVTSVEKNF